jgi:hypothetical protein
MSDVKDSNLIDAPVAPAHQAKILKDCRRPGRIYNVSPALTHSCATQRERLPVIFFPSIGLKSQPYGLPQPIRPTSGAV